MLSFKPTFSLSSFTFNKRHWSSAYHLAGASLPLDMGYLLTVTPTLSSEDPARPKINKYICNLDSILKSRDITLSTKVRLVKAMVFPVVMYGCESWTIKLSTEELMLLNCGVGEDS